MNGVFDDPPPGYIEISVPSLNVCVPPQHFWTLTSEVVQWFNTMAGDDWSYDRCVEGQAYFWFSSDKAKRYAMETKLMFG